MVWRRAWLTKIRLGQDFNRTAPTDLKHGGDIQRDIEEVDRGPADEEDQTDSNQDVVCPPSSFHLPHHADAGGFSTALDDWKRLTDFVIDIANDDAGYDVLDKKANNCVDEVVGIIRPVLNISKV